MAYFFSGALLKITNARMIFQCLEILREAPFTFVLIYK